MKKYFKLFLFALTTVLVVSCDKEDSRFDHNSEIGWVEFVSSASTTGQTVDNIQVPLAVEVPVYKNGLNISYTFTAVNGDYTSYVATTGGSTYADPSDETRNVNISIDLMNMEVGRSFTTSFDITLTAVDDAGVSVGLGDGSSTLVHRVTIPCSNPAVLPNTYFVGDYTIADVVATTGPNNGTENFEAGTVTLSVDGTDPNQRNFDVAVLPAFVAGTQPARLLFTTDNVVSLLDLDSTIGCSAPAYIYSDAGANNVAWDICDDQTITVTYTEDPLGSCGGPFEASFILTKI